MNLPDPWAWARRLLSGRPERADLGRYAEMLAEPPAADYRGVCDLGHLSYHRLRLDDPINPVNRGRCPVCGGPARLARCATSEGPNVYHLHRVALWLCTLCLNGAGGQCHVPGCTMWMRSAPDLPVADRVEFLPAPDCRDRTVDAGVDPDGEDLE